MKTSNSIEQQEERKKARGEPEKTKGKDPVYHAHNSVPVSVDREAARQRQLAGFKPYCFKPGQSGNPGGRPRDVAAEGARRCFEDDTEAVIAAHRKALLRGNAYSYQVLADRAYGKMRETHQLEVGPYHEVTDEQLEQQLKELKDQTGQTALENENAELKNELGELKQRFAEMERRIGIIHKDPALPPAPANIKPI